MSKYSYGQTNFLKGEASPRFRGRTNSEEYFQAVETMKNFIPLQQGGAMKRQGTAHTSVALSAGHALLPFIFNQSDASIIAIDPNGQSPNLGVIHNAISIIKNGTATASLTWGNQWESLDPRLDKNEFNIAQNGDVTVITHKSGYVAPIIIYRDVDGTYKADHIFRSADTNISGQLSESLRHAFLDPNTAAGKTITPSATTGSITLTASSSFFSSKHVDALFKLTIGGTVGVVRVTDVNGETVLAPANVNSSTDTFNIPGHGFNTGDNVFLRADDANSNALPVPLGTYGPDYFVIKVDNDNLKLALSSADATAGAAIDLLSTGAGVFYISDPDSLQTTATATVLQTLGGTSATDDWEEGAWSRYQGFPKTAVFFEERLVFGGTLLKPQTIWGSLSGNIYHFARRDVANFPFTGTEVATDPFAYTIASKEVNSIQWMDAGNVLRIGTTGAEYVATGGDTILSRDSVSIRRQTGHGSNSTNTASIDDSTIFLQRDGRSFRDYKFNDNNGSYVSLNISVMADHLFKWGFTGAVADDVTSDKFIDVAYMRTLATMWALTNRGTLVGFTKAKEGNVLAWHKHTLGGNVTFIHGLCVIPSANSIGDALFLCVERVVNSSTIYSIEYLDGTFFEHTDLAAYQRLPFMDRYLPGILASTTDTLDNTSFPLFVSVFDGETVDIIIDGDVYENQTVTASGVTLPKTYSAGVTISAGYKISGNVVTHDIAFAGDFGSPRGNKQRVDRASFQLDNSQGGKYKSNNNSAYQPIEYPSTALHTGIIRGYIDHNPEEEAKLDILHDTPEPFTLLAVTVRGVNYD